MYFIYGLLTIPFFFGLFVSFIFSNNLFILLGLIISISLILFIHYKATIRNKTIEKGVEAYSYVLDKRIVSKNDKKDRYALVDFVVFYLDKSNNYQSFIEKDFSIPLPNSEYMDENILVYNDYKIGSLIEGKYYKNHFEPVRVIDINYLERDKFDSFNFLLERYSLKIEKSA